MIITLGSPPFGSRAAVLGAAIGAKFFEPLDVSAANQLLGVKLGANVTGHRATPGHIQPE